MCSLARSLSHKRAQQCCSHVARRGQRRIKCLLEEGPLFAEVLVWRHLRLLLLVGQVVAEIFPARRVLEDRITVTLLARTNALLFFLALEARVSTRSRHFRALQLVLEVVETRLRCVESRLGHML